MTIPKNETPKAWKYEQGQFWKGNIWNKTVLKRKHQKKDHSEQETFEQDNSEKDKSENGNLKKDNVKQDKSEISEQEISETLFFFLKGTSGQRQFWTEKKRWKRTILNSKNLNEDSLQKETWNKSHSEKEKSGKWWFLKGNFRKTMILNRKK